MVLEFEIKGRDKDKPIRQDQFDFVLQKSKAELLPESRDFKTMYSGEIAWLLLNFVAEPEPRIRILLSLANPKLGFLLSDTIRTVASVAQHLESIASELKSCQEINQGNADELSDAAAPFFLQLSNRWESCLNEMNSASGAPLELPLDGKDYVAEYFCFNILLSQAVDISALDKQLGFSIKIKHDSPTEAAIFDKNSLRPLAKVKLLESGLTIRIQPFYWKENFSTVAAETIQIAELIAANFGARLHFFNTPVTDAFLAEMMGETKSLGLEFRDWSRKYR